MQFMFGIMLLLLAMGCGGAGGGSWDDFRARTATREDLSNHTFAFSWLPDGNPINPDLGAMSISFGTIDSAGKGTFLLTEHEGGSASGDIQLTGSDLEFSVKGTSGTIALVVDQEVAVKVEADETDGRIRLTNKSTNVSAASDR